MQSDGRNDLIPVDAKLRKGRNVTGTMIDMDTILAGLDEQVSTNILIFDACRLPFDSDSGCCRGVGRAVQKDGDLGRGDGLAEQVSLPFGASIGFQICQLPGVFDAFGGRRQAESCCETKDGADDDLGIVAFIEARHKAAINLDLVQTKRKQLAQRGITRSKIIERDADPGCP